MWKQEIKNAIKPAIKAFALVWVVALLLVGIVNLNSRGSISWVPYNSVEQLVASATDIVRVRVLDGRVDFYLPFGSYRSVHLEVNIVNRLRVIEVFHGETQPGDLIEVSQSRFGERYNWHQFRRGDDLVLFLRTFDDFPAVLLTPYYSVYRWPSLESAHPWNPITLTIEELNRISEEN